MSPIETLLAFPPVLLAVIVFFVGLLFGSFVSLAGYRLPRNRGKEIWLGRSACPKCRHRLGVLDLVPVFSWTWLKGKCRYCKAAISPRYPSIELITGLSFLLVYWNYGLSVEFFIIAGLAVCLMILIVTDFTHTIIPDSIQVAMILLGLSYQLYTQDINAQILLGPLAGVLAGLILRWAFTVWKGHEALGLGDVKFLATVGLFLSPKLIITFLFLAGMIGIVTALVWRVLGKGIMFPFGPALAVALFICLLGPETQEQMQYYFIDWVVRMSYPSL